MAIYSINSVSQGGTQLSHHLLKLGRKCLTYSCKDSPVSVNYDQMYKFPWEKQFRFCHILSHNLAKYLNRGGLKSLELIRRKTQGRTHALLTPHTINYNPTAL